MALESGDFHKAADLFDKIAELCFELGDDSVGNEFLQKGNKIKTILNS